jgi:signal transduction histidine kinase
VAHRPTVVAEPQAEAVDLRVEMREILDVQRKLCHSINNPLTAILGRAQMLQIRGQADPQLAKAIEVIEESAKRVASDVRQLSELIQRGRERLARD